MKQTLLSEDELRQRLEELNAGLENSWQIHDRVLSKVFTFRNFIEAFGFMTEAAIAAEKLNHHPDWSNVYKTVTVNLTTHESGGLTALDFSLAGKMEQSCKH